MIVSLGLLGLALRTLPLGTAYAIWTGVGTVGTALLGIMLSLSPFNHQQQGTAFETRNGRSALVAGTALHAPFRTLILHLKVLGEGAYLAAPKPGHNG
jgi:hypothetical protein